MRNFIDELSKYFEQIGLAKGDLYELPTSEKRFQDGAQYRIEVPTVAVTVHQDRVQLPNPLRRGPQLRNHTFTLLKPSS